MSESWALEENFLGNIRHNDYVQGETRYWHYQILQFARSGLILAVLFVWELIVHRDSAVLVIMFRSLKVEKNELQVYDVPLSMNVASGSKSVLNSYRWVIRATIVVVVCLVWEAAAVLNSTHSLEDSGDRNTIQFKCSTGWDCYSLHNPSEKSTASQTTAIRIAGSDFIRMAFVWDLPSVCPFNSSAPTPTEGSDRRSETAICYKVAQFDFVQTCGSIGVAAAVAVVICIVFELLIAIQYKHKWDVEDQKTTNKLSLSILILTWLSVVIWIVWLAISSAFGLSTWSNEITFLTVPILLWQSRRVAQMLQSQLRFISTSRIKTFVWPQANYSGSGEEGGLPEYMPTFKSARTAPVPREPRVAEGSRHTAFAPQTNGDKPESGAERQKEMVSREAEVEELLSRVNRTSVGVSPGLRDNPFIRQQEEAKRIKKRKYSS